MPTRKRYRSSGSLISETVQDAASLSSNGIAASKFKEFEHRSSKLVMKKFEADIGYRLGSAGNLQRCTFAIIAKPISEGVPVSSDLTNLKYLKWRKTCFASRFSSATGETASDDFVHFVEIMKIVVELGWDIYMTVLNGPGLTALFDYVVRLFVKYI